LSQHQRTPRTRSASTPELKAAVDLGLEQSPTFRGVGVEIVKRQAVVIVMRPDVTLETQRRAQLSRAATSETLCVDEQGRRVVYVYIFERTKGEWALMRGDTGVVRDGSERPIDVAMRKREPSKCRRYLRLL
jgi:hypothetical protein